MKTNSQQTKQPIQKESGDFLNEELIISGNSVKDKTADIHTQRKNHNGKKDSVGASFHHVLKLKNKEVL